jgi:hypothetical protein
MLRKSLLCGATAALLLSACEPADDAQSFRDGLPSRDMVEVKTPAQQSQAIGDGSVQSLATQGQISDLYQVTRGATAVVNGGTVFVLGLLENITQHAPTSISGDTAVWGPHTGALARNTWKLSVTRTGDHSYSYTLEGKDKTADDSAYVTVLSGTHTAAVNSDGERVKGFGSGSFTVNWEKASTLPERDDNVGTGEFTYSRETPTAVASIVAKFRNVRDGSNPARRVDGDYGYQHTPGAGGEFTFTQDKDVDGRTALERFTVKSRWQQTGAGRSDVRLSGGDLGTGSFTINECWDTRFLSTYYVAAFPGVDTSKNYGVESSCAFSTAVYAAAQP